MSVPDHEVITRLTPLQCVREFHRTFGCVTDAPWTPQLGELRAALIEEECAELGAALTAGNRLHIAQELADLAYVTIGAAVALGLGLPITSAAERADYGACSARCSDLVGSLRVGYLEEVVGLLPGALRCLYGMALAHGIDIEVAITAVHIANMSKLGPAGKPVTRSDGKILKSDNYRPPDLSAALHPLPTDVGGGDRMSDRSRSRAQDRPPTDTGE